jgi:DNA-binding Xre family transcriptional regulator
MEFKNRIKAEIYEQGYKSVLDFCKQKKLDYRKVNRMANNKSNGFYVEAVIEICEALDRNVGDLFYIERRGA